MKRNVFWGVILIAAAFLIVLDALNLVGDIPYVRIAIGIFSAARLITEIVKRHVSGIFFPLSFLFIAFEPYIAQCFELEPNIISNWIVLFAALLLTLGFALIFKEIKYDKYAKSHKITSQYNNHFSEGVIFIDCVNFEHTYIKNSFGETDIYFQNTDDYRGNATLTLKNSFGETRIHVPEKWNIRNNVTSRLGEFRYNRTTVQGEHTLNLNGKNAFGDIYIIIE